MRLMLLIIAMVLGSFILFNAFTRRKQSNQEKLHDEFEQSILKNSENQAMQIKRVEHMQQQHEAHSAYQREHSQSFTRPVSDPLMEDFKNPTFKEDGFVEQFNEIDVEEVYEEEAEKPKTHDFIALTVIPKQYAQFSGVSLQAALSKNHFRYGQQKLYHRHDQDNPAQPILYSVASLAKPGFFEQSTISMQSFPGILIYLLLDDVEDPVTAFEKMLTCARQLCVGLQAELCDAQKQPLSTSMIQQYREKAKAAAELSLAAEVYQEW
ncbi:MAG: cell division protein ZipA C-terminal FtsZ-binding domain-containing protein [Proteobacteria bacterium]|nr:cell division protein ZipA C-terminal FtsZ-binding domain-containing protein [Pseudomonadota bacterium]